MFLFDMKNEIHQWSSIGYSLVFLARSTQEKPKRELLAH